MSTLLRAEDEPVASRADYWRHVVADTIAPMALQVQGPGDFHSQIHAGNIGPVQVTDMIIPRAQLTRSPSLIRQRDPDWYKIDLLIAGRLLIRQDEREAVLSPGDFCLVDLSHPCHWVNAPGRLVAVSFPRDMLPLRRDETAQLTGESFGPDGEVAGMVSALTRRLLRHLGTERDGTRLGIAMLDLLTVTLADRLDRAAEVPRQTRRRSLLLRVQSFIEERLGDPELSPQMIAAAHFISVRHLHALFADQHETVAAWIRMRRLDRCRRDLVSLVRPDQTVASIGARWGFTSPDHFSRAFRRQFGMTPSDARRRMPTPG